MAGGAGRRLGRRKRDGSGYPDGRKSNRSDLPDPFAPRPSAVGHHSAATVREGQRCWNRKAWDIVNGSHYLVPPAQVGGQAWVGVRTTGSRRFLSVAHERTPANYTAIGPLGARANETHGGTHWGCGTIRPIRTGGCDALDASRRVVFPALIAIGLTAYPDMAKSAQGICRACPLPPAG